MITKDSRSAPTLPFFSSCYGTVKIALTHNVKERPKFLDSPLYAFFLGTCTSFPPSLSTMGSVLFEKNYS